MNTNQFWTTENIKAIGELWPLALIIFLTLALIVVLVFFLPQTRKILNDIKTLKLQFWKTEVALNQPSIAATKADTETNAKEASTSAPKTETKEELPPKEKDQPEFDWNTERGMQIYLLTGELDNAEKTFKHLQSITDDPEERIRLEAYYLQERFEKGDSSAQEKLRQLEIRAKEVKSKRLGYVIRLDALCYVFSGDWEKAVLRFKDSANSAASDEDRATSMVLAAKNLYEIPKKADAFQLLKDEIDSTSDSKAKSRLLVGLAELYKDEKDNFSRVLALQRALSFQPVSKDLLFDTAYACSESDFNELAMLYYEKLVEIDWKHNSALNNLGVAFANLKIPSLAIKNYKRAIDAGETLSASNLANILIDIGALDDAEKLLVEAKNKKKVHQNVMSSLVALETAKKEDGESRNKCFELAKAQHQFLLGFSDAAFLAKPSKFNLDGKWENTSVEIISNKIESATDKLELIWVESNGAKFKFYGNIRGLASEGQIETWKEPYFAISALLGGKQEGKFETYGSGFVVLSNKLDKLTIFIQESGNKNHRSFSVNKINE
jgi:Flp pilus assembly protein TadD